MSSYKVSLFILIASLTIASKADPSDIVLLISGEETGYLESTGCEGDVGGLAKRATLLRSLQQQYPASLNIHVGDILDAQTRIAS